jgi:EAL domain-containing protein (putative c-di-GMP-specific phosphodiesterase class I)
MRHHPHEAERLESLRSYELLETPPEPAYDGLTRLAALLCKTPVALISLVDDSREWFKSTYGFSMDEAPRESAICSDVVADQRPIVVQDAVRDTRYGDNPGVTGAPGIRAYAGVPLIGRDGLALGALCVIDWRPRRFSPTHVDGLELLATQVVAQLELRRVDVAAGRGPGTLLTEASDPLRLRQALDNGEFVPHFQPMVDLHTGLTRGFEALLRWQHPSHGLLPPALFLPAIESSRLVIPVGRQVLDCSLDMVVQLNADPTVPETLGVAVNVSGVQLQQPGIAETVLSSLERHGLPTAQLSVEITETAPIFEPEVARRELLTLREAGVNLALDDYGMGYSALSRLLELPLSALKLDRSLVDGLPGNERSVAVAKSTLALAGDMGIEVVCEGIETVAQHQALLEMGANYGQGWLFARPMDRHALVSHLRSQAHVHLSAAAGVLHNVR